MTALCACAQGAGEAEDDASGTSQADGSGFMVGSSDSGASTSAGSGGAGSGTTNASSAVTSSGSGAAGPSGGTCYVGMGECNPLTDSCATGEACEVSGEDFQFYCFPPPNTASLGGTCDPSNGPFCQDGLTCVANVCTPYCCDDGDCNGGTCAVVQEAGAIEIKACVTS